MDKTNTQQREQAASDARGGGAVRAHAVAVNGLQTARIETNGAPSPNAGLSQPVSLLASPRDAQNYPFRRRYRRPILTLAAAVVGAAGLLLWRDPTSAILFLGCVVVAFLLVPGIARLAFHHGAVSLPGGRAVHDVPIPLVGGAALFIPVAGTLLALGLTGDQKAWGLLAGGSLVFACGLVDDVRGASARTKILMQLLAGGALLLAGFELRGLGIPGLGTLEFGSGPLGAALLLFWIVLATNALNLSDGLDGLATSLAVLGMGVLAAGGVGSLLPIALAGASLGFLYYNLPRARIFLGDAGSMLLGFLLAALVLELPVGANVPLGLAALAYPLGDVILTVSRRFIRGKPLFAPDKSHVHHKVLEELGSPLRGLLAVLCFAILQAVLLVLWPGVTTLLVCCGLWFVLSAALVRNGSCRPGSLIAQRRLMRRLHVAHGYAAATLQLAEDRTDVEMVLQHLIEATEVCEVSIDGLDLRSRRGPGTRGAGRGCADGCAQHSLALRGRSCTWRAPFSPAGAAIDEERETVLANVLRFAADRLETLPAVFVRGSGQAVGAVPEASPSPAGAVVTAPSSPLHGPG